MARGSGHGLIPSYVIHLSLNVMVARVIVNGICVLYDDICVVKEIPLSQRDDIWAEKAKRLLRAEMARQGVTYDDLARRLAELGIADNPPNLRNKVSRGTFTAAFLLQCMEAIGCKTLRLE